MSNFQKVKQFNKAFGVNQNETIQKDLFTKDPELVKYRMSLIMEEVGELQDAVKNHDFTETIDALTDILYVVYGAYTSFGVDADDAFDVVQKSNMSKLCKSEEDAIETVKRYKEEVPERYDSPNYRRSEDGIHWVVYNESTMKILKNYKYTTVDFTKVFERTQEI